MKKLVEVSDLVYASYISYKDQYLKIIDKKIKNIKGNKYLGVLIKDENNQYLVMDDMNDVKFYREYNLNDYVKNFYELYFDEIEDEKRLLEINEILSYELGQDNGDGSETTFLPIKIDIKNIQDVLEKTSHDKINLDDFILIVLYEGISMTYTFEENGVIKEYEDENYKTLIIKK